MSPLQPVDSGSPSEVSDPNRFLMWKVRAFAIGAALGLGGIITSNDLLIVAGVVVLVVGLGARVMEQRAARGAANSDLDVDCHVDVDVDAEDDHPNDQRPI